MVGYVGRYAVGLGSLFILIEGVNYVNHISNIKKIGEDINSSVKISQTRLVYNDVNPEIIKPELGIKSIDFKGNEKRVLFLDNNTLAVQTGDKIGFIDTNNNKSKGLYELKSNNPVTLDTILGVVGDDIITKKGDKINIMDLKGEEEHSIEGNVSAKIPTYPKGLSDIVVAFDKPIDGMSGLYASFNDLNIKEIFVKEEFIFAKEIPNQKISRDGKYTLNVNKNNELYIHDKIENKDRIIVQGNYLDYMFLPDNKVLALIKDKEGKKIEIFDWQNEKNIPFIYHDTKGDSLVEVLNNYAPHIGNRLDMVGKMSENGSFIINYSGIVVLFNKTEKGYDLIQLFSPDKNDLNRLKTGMYDKLNHLVQKQGIKSIVDAAISPKGDKIAVIGETKQGNKVYTFSIR